MKYLVSKDTAVVCQRVSEKLGFDIKRVVNELSMVRGGGLIKMKYPILLYGKPSSTQIPVLGLVLSRSGFCSTDRFHGPFPTIQSTYFCFEARLANSKFATETARKNVKIVILHIETTSRS